MGALFLGASTQYLVNSAPAIVGYPFSVGMWLNLTAVGTVVRTLFALSDTGTTNNYLAIKMDATEKIKIHAIAGGAAQTATLATVLAANRPVYIVARFLSSVSRRLSLMQQSGNFQAIADTGSAAPTGMDTITIGALSTSAGIAEPWDGIISEYWITNSDVRLNTQNTILPLELVWQLAFGGPLSIPHIAKDLVEYRSFRSSPDSSADVFNEVYHGKFGQQRWTNTNGVSLGKHPPIPYWNVKRGQRKRVLPI